VQLVIHVNEVGSDGLVFCHLVNFSSSFRLVD